IPRMRIGMEHTVNQNLLQVTAKQFVGEAGPIDLHQTKRTDVGDFLSRNVFHRQHARSAVVHDRLGNDYPIKLAQVIREHREVVSLSFEVELLKQTLSQADEHVSEFVTPPEFGVRIQKLSYLFESVEVFHNLFANVGPLNFYYDRAPVPHVSAVNLSKRCGAERLGFKLGKGLRQSHAKLAGNNRVNFLIRERRNLILQARERIEIRRRQKIGAGGKQLAQFDEGGTKLFEVSGKLLSFRDFLCERGFIQLQVFAKTGLFDQIRAAILHEQHGNVFVSFQVFSIKRDHFESFEFRVSSFEFAQ